MPRKAIDIMWLWMEQLSRFEIKLNVSELNVGLKVTSASTNLGSKIRVWQRTYTIPIVQKSHILPAKNDCVRIDLDPAMFVLGFQRWANAFTKGIGIRRGDVVAFSKARTSRHKIPTCQCRSQQKKHPRHGGDAFFNPHFISRSKPTLKPHGYRSRILLD